MKSYGTVGAQYVPAQCEKYLPLHNVTGNNTCAATSFIEKIVTCDKWVFDKTEKTIVNEVSNELSYISLFQ